jgi:lysyl-tRNA synthetase class 1
MNSSLRENRRCSIGAKSKTLEEAPIMAHIAQKIMAEDHVTAVIGSVQEDPFGRLFQQAKFSFAFSAIWLEDRATR